MTERKADDEAAQNKRFPHQFWSVLDVSCVSDGERDLFPLEKTDSQQAESIKTKKRRVPTACIPCKQSRSKCSNSRPCSRCISSSKVDDCVDGPLHEVPPTTNQTSTADSFSTHCCPTHRSRICVSCTSCLGSLCCACAT